METVQIIKIVEVQTVGIGCPVQWECRTDKNFYIYIRYRGGKLSACGNFGESNELTHKQMFFAQLYNQRIKEDFYDGYISTHEMMGRLRKVFDFSAAEILENGIYD